MIRMSSASRSIRSGSSNASAVDSISSASRSRSGACLISGRGERRSGGRTASCMANFLADTGKFGQIIGGQAVMRPAMVIGPSFRSVSEATSRSRVRGDHALCRGTSRSRYRRSLHLRRSFRTARISARTPAPPPAGARGVSFSGPSVRERRSSRAPRRARYPACPAPHRAPPSRRATWPHAIAHRHAVEDWNWHSGPHPTRGRDRHLRTRPRAPS